MAVALYMDHHVPRAITAGLRIRGVGAITAEEDGAKELDDPRLLDRATALGRALFTYDDDLLTEANRRQGVGIPFAGVIYAHPLRVSIGRCIHDLQIIAEAGEPQDLWGQIQFLPL